MNTISQGHERQLQSGGFISSDESFLYLGKHFAIRGELSGMKIITSKGDSMECETEDEFVDLLLYLRGDA